MAKAKAEKPKAKKSAAAKPRTARVYRVVESKARLAEQLTSKQAPAVYGVLARNKAGLTAAQLLEKLDKQFVSKNPASVLAAVLYDLRKGTGVCAKVGPGLVEIVEAAPAEKKPKPKGKYVKKIERENKAVALLEENRKKNTAPAA